MKTISTMSRFVLIALTCLLVACGHTEDDEAQVRVFNGLYRWAAFDLYVDEDPQLEDFPYGELSNYIRLGVKTGSGGGGGGGGGGDSTTTSSTSSTMLESFTAETSHDTSTTTTTTSGSTTTTSSTTTTIARESRTFSVFVDAAVTSVLEQTITLTSDKKYTLFAFGGWDHVAFEALQRFVVVERKKEKPLKGKLKIRIASMGPAVNLVDVYIVPTGSPIVGRVPVHRNLAPSQLTAYFDINPAQYDIVFAEASSKSIVFNSGPIDLAVSTVQTLVTYDTRGTGLPIQHLMMTD